MEQILWWSTCSSFLSSLWISFSFGRTIIYAVYLLIQILVVYIFLNAQTKNTNCSFSFSLSSLSIRISCSCCSFSAVKHCFVSVNSFFISACNFWSLNISSFKASPFEAYQPKYFLLKISSTVKRYCLPVRSVLSFKTLISSCNNLSSFSTSNWRDTKLFSELLF